MLWNTQRLIDGELSEDMFCKRISKAFHQLFF